jgi:Icc-related predicted phosphoesterase
MAIHTSTRPAGDEEQCRIRIAAAGDVHYGRDGDRDRAAAAFASLAGRVDLVLLAGDLTTHGEPQQATIIGDAVRELGVPVLTVLGNHDWHSNRAAEVVAALQEAGVVVLDRSHHVLEICGAEVGIVGTKGFVGGFAGSHIPDFGEPLLRRVYAEGMEEVAALDAGLRAVALCPVRIVLLHYAPVAETLEGEPPGIWTMLGSDRLAVPIVEHEPDLVLHGHAHSGTFRGTAGTVPVFNVSVPVMGRDFWVFEVADLERTTTPVH